ncbi:unnamed protein product [Rhizoctonia solani]|uniref:DUF6533 domain-containing protein n=1 Tax=Rhizoctonia solani TaxID=456999 RepID=A0A8H3BXD5_9AGAM|nr:unnamed protein product [Rhizoctonia solani]
MDPDTKTAYMNILGAKYLSMVSCSLLIYDILTTLPTEVRYVWRSRWSFGRVAFHINRMWAPIVLAKLITALFMYHLSDTMYEVSRHNMMSIQTKRLLYRCIFVSLFYIYGSVVAMLIVTSVLIVRIWVIYDRKLWVLIVVCAGCLAVSAPSLVFLQVQAQRKNLVANPAPDFVTGCIFKSNPVSYIPYIAPFIYETALFGMTVYKTCQLSRGHVATPIIARLMQDGSNYYFVVIGTLVFVGLGSLSPAVSPAVNGSGIFLAVLSSMCSRLILSTRSFYNDAKVTDDFLEMENLPKSTSNQKSSALGACTSTEALSHYPPRKLNV